MAKKKKWLAHYEYYDEFEGKNKSRNKSCTTKENAKWYMKIFESLGYKTLKKEVKKKKEDDK
jgi:hypothetical protein